MEIWIDSNISFVDSSLRYEIENKLYFLMKKSMNEYDIKMKIVDIGGSNVTIRSPSKRKIDSYSDWGTEQSPRKIGQRTTSKPRLQLQAIVESKNNENENEELSKSLMDHLDAIVDDDKQHENDNDINRHISGNNIIYHTHTDDTDDHDNTNDNHDYGSTKVSFVHLILTNLH